MQTRSNTQTSCFAATLIAFSLCFSLEEETWGQDNTRENGATEWVNLFDEQTLRGWVQRGGKSKFQADEQTIVGTTVRGEPNSYLCTEREFDNFELSLEFRTDDPNINSGVQIRSQSLVNFLNGLVHGYQVEIDPSDRNWTGAIYDENRRGWLFKPDSSDLQRPYKMGQWNRMKIVCLGDSIKTWLNDTLVADLHDNTTPKGFIALQLHSTSIAKPLSIRWRRIRIRELELK